MSVFKVFNILSFTLGLFLNFVLASEDLLVSTGNGQVRGKILPTASGNTMYAFQGIPYAVPPLGKYRFQATKPAKNWTGILDATEESKDCIGVRYFKDPEAQSEDCLYLNVYTPSLPKLNNSELLPVIFFIHGGRFVEGSSNMSRFGPGYLVDHDVVFVSARYRLGPYGFLSTEDLVVPGNAGLKDQLLALKWVHQNIKSFGGDTSKITIEGHSAGGASCGLHLMSKKSKGLFRAAICQAGSAVVPWAVYNSPRNYTIQLINLLNNQIAKDRFDSKEDLKFLRKQRPADIMRAAIILEQTLPKEDKALTPVIEPIHNEAFLMERPYELMLKGDFHQVPLLIGIGTEEAITYVPNRESAIEVAAKLDNEPEFVYPYNFVRKVGSDEVEIQNFIKKMYLKDGQKFSDDLLNVLKFKSDEMFNRGTIKHALMQSKFTDVFFYQFSYSGGLNQYDVGIPGCEGKTQHGDVQKYTFTNGVNYNHEEADELTFKRMSLLITNFVKYLNPTPNKSELLQNITWPKVKEDNFLYLDIDKDLSIKKDPKNETFPLWTEFFEKYSAKPMRTF